MGSNTHTDFKKLKKQMKEFQRIGKGAVRGTLKKEITRSIERGVSPVKGQGRFEGYSDYYLEQIKAGEYKEYGKKKRPVNLKLTGELLKSLIVEVTSKGLSIMFTSPLAYKHNTKGVGRKNTRRRMLPTEEGEEFSRSITMRVKRTLKRVAKVIFK